MIKCISNCFSFCIRQSPPDLERQNISESHSGSDLRQQEESDGFEDPFSSERLTEVPIEDFYLKFQLEFRLRANKRLIEL